MTSIFDCRALLAALISVVGVTPLYSQPAAKAEHLFRGKVESVDLQAQAITVNGERVEGWMAAMTMSYTVDAPQALRKIKAGDEISAKVYDGDFKTLHGIQVVAAQGGPPATRSQAAAQLVRELGGIADDEEIAFVCPMHSDYTSEQAGKCPRCGMALVPGTPFDMRDYHLDFKTVPAIPQAGEKLTLSFNVSHPGTGQPIKDFEIVHDKRWHLFVLSQDMNFFEHIHPVEAKDGTWSIDVTLPKPGVYGVFSDFMPSSGASQFLARPLITKGFRGDILAQGARLVPDTSPTQTVDDLTATVEYDPPTLLAGSYGHLTFHLKNAVTDQPVLDLQTYLGAFGHMLIMSEDMVNYVHAHPTDILPPDQNVETLRGGPTVMFEGLMPKPGRYRAWTQFRYHDKVHTVVNTFEVHDIGDQRAN